MTNADAAFADLRVVYLEDEVLIALDVASALRDAGCAVVRTAHRLKNAAQFVDEETFDVALLDINVDGGQTSLELGRRLKSDGTVVIFASGNGADCDRLRSEGYAFIDKPFSHAALFEQIKVSVSERV